MFKLTRNKAKINKNTEICFDFDSFQIGLVMTLYNKLIQNNLEKQWRKMNGQVRIEESLKIIKVQKKTKPQSSESDQFQLQYHQIKKLGLPVNKKKLRVGNWAPQQNIIYLKFLEQNKRDFISEQQRRKNKVFYRLSKILKKRTPDQCRSHHQKLQMKYQDKIEDIIESIKKKLQKKSSQIFEDDYKKVDICNKKTGIIDIIEQKLDEVIVLEQGQFYRFFRKGENQFSLDIIVDRIKSWN